MQPIRPSPHRCAAQSPKSTISWLGDGNERAGLSTGAAPVRVSGRAIDSGSRGASNDQGGSTGFPDLLSKMGAADSAPGGRPAISMQERRSTWGAAASRTASAQDEANDDAEAALAALLAGQSERSMEAADQSATGQQPVTSPPDTALAGMRGGADGGSMWSAAVQMQALMTTGVGAPQGTSEMTGGSERSAKLDRRRRDLDADGARRAGFRRRDGLARRRAYAKRFRRTARRGHVQGSATRFSGGTQRGRARGPGHLCSSSRDAHRSGHVGAVRVGSGVRSGCTDGGGHLRARVVVSVAASRRGRRRDAGGASRSHGGCRLPRFRGPACFRTGAGDDHRFDTAGASGADWPRSSRARRH